MDMAEARKSAQIGNVFVRETNVFQKIERLFQACGHQIIAAMRKLPNKQFEGGAGLEAVLHIAGRHGEFIEVGEES